MMNLMQSSLVARVYGFDKDLRRIVRIVELELLLRYSLDSMFTSFWLCTGDWICELRCESCLPGSGIIITLSTSLALA